MAGVGPLTSIALGIGFSALGSFAARTPADLTSQPLAALQQMGPIATLLTWLGPINLLVGIFNLVPAFPLDGGRVFRQ
jgi:Zn-dependent protease